MMQSRVAFNRVSQLLRCFLFRVSDTREHQEGFESFENEGSRVCAKYESRRIVLRRSWILRVVQTTMIGRDGTKSRRAFNRVISVAPYPVSQVFDGRECRECRKRTKCRAFVPSINREEDLGFSKEAAETTRLRAGRSDQRTIVTRARKTRRI
ncbi:uncharacterized protein LOC120359204 [Solenopsis invicta]|uniref:uncharacterized protein LOC120359204 n=1 Tax=Solenopsis invicta TaxID=13686 RepID=UPI00193E7CDB|nr:uncharacterized protein LOC120359204 [Solenopsis invicta]